MYICTEDGPKLSAPVRFANPRCQPKQPQKKKRKIRFEYRAQANYLRDLNFWFPFHIFHLDSLDSLILRSAPHIYIITKFLRFLNWQFLTSLAMVGNSRDIATRSLVVALKTPCFGEDYCRSGRYHRPPKEHSQQNLRASNFPGVQP